MATERTLSVYWDDLFLTHAPSTGVYEYPEQEWLAVDEPHPERPARLLNIRSAITHWLSAWTTWRSPRDATRDELTAVHDAAYLDELEDISRRGGERITPTTEAGPSTYRTAVRAAGAAIEAGVEALERENTVPYALVRPPGHHAQPALVDGYCFINSVAVAAEHVLNTGRVNRVAILDWDVHHGNGTQECFYDRDDVLVVNLHNDFGAWGPNHPQTGAVDEQGTGPGEGTTVNVPLPPGTGNRGYQYAFDAIVDPVITQFDPDLILVSAGQDPGIADPGGRNVLRMDGFRALAARTRDLATRCTDGAWALVQEGGYQISHLPFATLGVLEGALDVDTGAEDPFYPLAENYHLATQWVDTAVEGHRTYWDL